MIDAILEDVAKATRQRRKVLGLSQEELAAKAGLHRTYVGAIERGERNFTLVILRRLADALGCEPADLLARR